MYLGRCARPVSLEATPFGSVLRVRHLEIEAFESNGMAASLL